MKVEFYFAGKTTDDYLRSGIDIYLQRLQHYLPVAAIVFEPPRSAKDPTTATQAESAKMMERLKPSDYVVLLDEKGKSLSSEGLSRIIAKLQLESREKLVFVTGGAYGVSEELKRRANYTLSFSALTFTHQMIRLLLAEQLYRAMTILRNEKYHHG